MARHGNDGSVTDSGLQQETRCQVSGVRCQETILRPDIEEVSLCNFSSQREYTTQATHSSLSFELATAGNGWEGVGDFGEGGQFCHVWAEQFGGETPAPVPVWAAGVFMRASLPRPSASCSGTTQRLARIGGANHAN